MAANREWRKPTEADRGSKWRARNRFEKRPYYVEWNAEWDCWAISGRPHILVRVDEIFATPSASVQADGSGTMGGK